MPHREHSNCAYCGRPLPKYKKKYCSSTCRLLANGQLKDTENNLHKEGPKLSAAEINRLARAENLSYGEYVSKYKL